MDKGGKGYRENWDRDCTAKEAKQKASNAGTWREHVRVHMCAYFACTSCFNFLSSFFASKAAALFIHLWRSCAKQLRQASASESWWRLFTWGCISKSFWMSAPSRTTTLAATKRFEARKEDKEKIADTLDVAWILMVTPLILIQVYFCFDWSFSQAKFEFQL